MSNFIKTGYGCHSRERGNPDLPLQKTGNHTKKPGFLPAYGKQENKYWVGEALASLFGRLKSPLPTLSVINIFQIPPHPPFLKGGKDGIMSKQF
jgi:hypothetical protein